MQLGRARLHPTCRLAPPASHCPLRGPPAPPPMALGPQVGTEKIHLVTSRPVCLGQPCLHHCPGFEWATWVRCLEKGAGRWLLEEKQLWRVLAFTGTPGKWDGVMARGLGMWRVEVGTPGVLAGGKGVFRGHSPWRHLCPLPQLAPRGPRGRSLLAAHSCTDSGGR